MIKKILRPFAPWWVLNISRKRSEKIQFRQWEENGHPVPPPHIVKQMTITEYKDKYGYEILVETGTFWGDMVEAQKKRFQKIYSIELGIDLFNKATKRFHKNKNITIIQGDSGKVLPKILSEINEPAIFWLDGHYSWDDITAKAEKACPILEELDAIFNAKELNHILLIDDARLFTGEGDYPTFAQLIEYIKNKNEKYQVEVKNDIIRFVI